MASRLHGSSFRKSRSQDAGRDVTRIRHEEPDEIKVLDSLRLGQSSSSPVRARRGETTRRKLCANTQNVYGLSSESVQKTVMMSQGQLIDKLVDQPESYGEQT